MKNMPELGIAIERQRVLPLWTVQGDGRDAQGKRPTEMARLERTGIKGHAVVAPSTVTQVPVADLPSGWQR